MDPQLKALLDKYAAAGASDDELRQVASDWTSKNAQASAPPATPAASLPTPAQPGLLDRLRGLQQSTSLMPNMDDLRSLTPSNLRTEAYNLGQSVPGGTALQAVGAMLPRAIGGQGLGYSDAYNWAKQQTAGLPTSHKVIADLAGGAATAGLGGSAATAAYPMLANASAKAIGVVTPFVNSILNPQPTTPGSAALTAGESLAGGLLPSVLKMGGARVQSGLAPTADVVMNDARNSRIATDELNFGKVADEAEASGGTNPAIRSALANPKIAPFVDAVRRLSPDDISDADVLRKTYSLMSERQGAIIPADAVDLGMGSTLEKRFLGAQKGSLLQGATGAGAQYTPATLHTIPAQPAQTVQMPAMQTAQSPTPDLRTAIGNFWDRQAAAAARSDQGETVQQQMARTALERHGAENVVSPPLSGAPPGPRIVQIAPPVPQQTNVVTPASVQPIPASMPSLPAALAAHAENMQAADAGDLAAKVGRRQFSGTLDPTNSLKGEKLGFAGFAQNAAQNSPAEQQMAQARALAELKNYPVFARLGTGRISSNIPIPLVPGLATRQAPAMLNAVGGSGMNDYLTRLITGAATSPFGQ